jgi:hypothetical protein
MGTVIESGVLKGLQPLADFAKDVDRHPEVVKRWIRLRGCPATRVGPDIYIDPPKAREWIDAGMKPPAPPAQPIRRQARRRRPREEAPST